MAKKGKSKSTEKALIWIAGILAFALVAVVISNMYFSIGNTGSSSSGITITEDGQSAVCSSETTPDLLIQAYDNENPGTAIVETLSYRKVGTTVWQTGMTGTKIADLEANAEYEFILGVNSSDQTDNAYGSHFTHKVSCQSDETIEMAMYNDEVETSLSSTFYNNDGDASAQTFSAGDVYAVSIKFKASSDKFFGNPNLDNPNVIVLKLNNSEWDKPQQVYLADGTELKSVSVPSRYDQQASGFTEYAYALPVITDKEIKVFMDLEADDTNAPSGDGTAYVYAGGYFINENSEVASGVEDDDDNAVATDSPDTVTLDFTA